MPDSFGIDIAGIVAPLVTTAFGLVNGVLVDVTIACGASAKLNMKSDSVTASGGTAVVVKAMMYRDQNQELPTVDSRTSTIAIDPAALKKACAAAKNGAGVALPPLNVGDAIAVADDTGTKQWTIYQQNPVPGGLLRVYQIRR